MSNNKYDEDTLNIALQDYRRFVYHNIGGAEERELVFTIKNIPVVNAFATYKPNCDLIEVYEGLFSRVQNLIFNNFEDNDRAAYILFNAFFFLTFHELGHLYCGHCQLSDSKSLSALPSENKSGFSDSDELATEMDADMFASRRTAEKTASLLKDGSYKRILNYTDAETFCLDALVGIHAAFWIIYYNEVSSRRYSNTHPPSIARCYYSGNVFMQHLEQFFGIKMNMSSVVDIIMRHEEIFAGFSLEPDKKQIKYRYLTGGQIDSDVNNAIQYWNTILRPQLMLFSRVPM